MSWQFFSLEEFTCKCGCNTNQMDWSFISKLDELRLRCGFPLVVTSGYRCGDHPEEAKKEKPGTHNAGIAADVRVSNGRERYILLREAFQMGCFKGIGTGSDFIHMDGREKMTSWGY